MKRILQTLDSASSKSVEGADSMAKFLRIVDEAAINQPAVKPVKVPTIPQLPAQDGDQGDGSKLTTNPDGTKTYAGAFGTFTYDKSGKAITYSEPQLVGGLGRSIDLVTGQTTQNYNNGSMNATQTVDAKGNVVSHNTEYDLGVGKFAAGQDANGIRSKSFTPTDGEQGLASKDIYALGDKDKEATYNRAMAQANGAPIQENSLNKFLSIVKTNDVGILNEGASPHKVSLPVQMAMQHYQNKEAPVIRQSRVGNHSVVGNYFHKVEQEQLEKQHHKLALINQYASTIAERVLMKESAAQQAAIAIAKQKSGKYNKDGKRIKENEIPDHSMGFKPGPGMPGIQNAVSEAPLDFDKDVPMSSTIHGHQGANPASIQARIMRARRQLQELSDKANSDNLIVWENIAKHFPELVMNIEQIRHGIQELANIRKQGGRRTANIPKDIGETNSIKQANNKKRRLKT